MHGSSGAKDVAVCAGTVYKVIKNHSKYGNYVILKHTFTVGDEKLTFYTQYCHMKDNSIVVKEGQSVSQGQVLGTQGHTGNASGDHCHLEFAFKCPGTQLYNYVEDPLTYLYGGKVFDKYPKIKTEYWENSSLTKSYTNTLNKISSSTTEVTVTVTKSAFKKLSTAKKRQAIVDLAKQFEGGSYVSGKPLRTNSSLKISPSTIKSNGVDCSGLVWYVYAYYGYNLNATASTQAKNGKHVDASATDTSNLEPGDLLIFNDKENKNIGHIGIYIGDGKFIHADNPDKGVIITKLSSSYYKARLVEVRRIIY